jgi:hypothetical protein
VPTGAFWDTQIECNQTKDSHRHWFSREGRYKSSGLGKVGEARRQVACAVPKRCRKQSICRGGWGALATEGGGLAARVVQSESVDHKDSDVGHQSELMATTKCQFYGGKADDSMVLA